MVETSWAHPDGARPPARDRDRRHRAAGSAGTTTTIAVGTIVDRRIGTDHRIDPLGDRGFRAEIAAFVDGDPRPATRRRSRPRKGAWRCAPRSPPLESVRDGPARRSNRARHERRPVGDDGERRADAIGVAHARRAPTSPTRCRTPAPLRGAARRRLVGVYDADADARRRCSPTGFGTRFARRRRGAARSRPPACGRRVQRDRSSTASSSKLAAAHGLPRAVREADRHHARRCRGDGRRVRASTASSCTSRSSPASTRSCNRSAAAIAAGSTRRRRRRWSAATAAGRRCRRSYPAWITDAGAAGGGALIDHSVHVIDVMRHVTGRRGRARQRRGRRPLLGHRRRRHGRPARVSFDNGAIAAIDPSWSVPAGNPWDYDFFLRVLGTNGAISIDDTAESLRSSHGERGDATGAVRDRHRRGDGRRVPGVAPGRRADRSVRHRRRRLSRARDRARRLRRRPPATRCSWSPIGADRP